MAERQTELSATATQLYMKRQLESGFTPSNGRGVSNENRQASALEFITYAMGELVKEIHELRREIALLQRRV